MTTERAEKLDKLMQNVFDAIEEYQETLKKSDIKWAERYLESENRFVCGGALCWRVRSV